MEEIEAQGFAPYYTDHTVGIWPQAAGGVPFNACEFQSKGDVITDLFEDMAAEGLTADNLGLQSRDYYKDIQQVKDTFVDKNGRFDDKAYNAFYDNCLSLYNEYAMQDYEKLAIQNFEYNPDV